MLVVMNVDVPWCNSQGRAVYRSKDFNNVRVFLRLTVVLAG